MSLNEVAACTPRYVLLEGNRPLGPEVMPSDSGVQCSVIYGFSGKAPYDRFCGNTDRALRPYPLVEGYLRSSIDQPGDELKLVVLDADGPSEECLHTATMEAVLRALENRDAHLPAGRQLVFDQQANAYRSDGVQVD